MLQYVTRSRSSKQKGFTLIELLVVIAIIGILASVVLASLNSARKKSRDARRVADIKQVQLALELYFDANGNKYPAGPFSALGAALAPTYIPVVSNDPVNVAPQVYKYCKVSDTSYVLAATLEETTNPALPGANRDASACASGDQFNGADAGVYDVVP